MSQIASRPRLPDATDDPEQIRANIDEFGVCVVPEMLSGEQVAQVRQRLVEQAAGERAAGVATSPGGPLGPDDPIQYVWGLIHKGQVFRDLVLYPRALELARYVLGPDLLLFSYTGNAIGPGAPGGGAHSDQIYMPSDTPWAVLCNVIYMLDDFTEDNGATLVVPGSHRRSIDELNGESFAASAVSALGRTGSALVMESRIWHSIGVNRTTDNVRHGILTAYCKPFLRTQSNWVHTTPPEMVDGFSPELQELLGYHVWRSLGGLQGPHGEARDYGDYGDHHGSDRPARINVDVDWGWAPADPSIVSELTPAGVAPLD
jgi:ectoine hydroxylase-related dioxygenase (phytanoyl-CoA dioxygenase family)